jgi:hypothetical protein
MWHECGMTNDYLPGDDQRIGKVHSTRTGIKVIMHADSFCVSSAKEVHGPFDGSRPSTPLGDRRDLAQGPSGG